MKQPDISPQQSKQYSNPSFLRRWFATRSIKSKLKIVIMMVSSMGILLAGFSLIVYERFSFRQNMLMEMSTLAEVVASNSKSAVLSDNTSKATEALTSLASEHSIFNAAIYHKNGALLASYTRQQQNNPKSTLTNKDRVELSNQSFRFMADFLAVSKPIMFEGRQIGSVDLNADYTELHRILNRFIITMLIILLVIESLAYILTSRLQNYISQPLVFLASVARKISLQQDYSLRARKQSDDELGSLTDDFNAMLHQVEKRDRSLRKSEQRFEALIEHAADALYLCTQDGTILHVNQSACRSLGYTQKELLKMSMADIDITFLPSDTASKTSTSLQQAWQQLKPGESKTSYSNLECVDGRTFPVELHFGLLELEDDHCVLAFARDISERKQTEVLLQQTNDALESKVVARTQELSESNQQLLKAKDKAEAASRAKSEFLANMSHEIRTPMNSLMGFTDLLHDTTLSAKQQAYLSSIQSSAKGLMTIINDVLDLSKIEAGKLDLEYEPVNTHAFIQDIEQLLTQGISDKGLDFDLLIDSDLPHLLIFDQTRVRQILFNLISNAIKFTTQGYIRITVSHMPNPSTKNTTQSPDAPPQSTVNLSISIKDTGIGIKNDQIESIFEQFTQQEGQSTRKYGGTGLGLAICNNLAKMMGGSIILSSEVGKGSVFTLKLVNIVVAPELKKVLPSTTPEGKIVFRAAKVLLVDDIEANRLLLKEQFLQTDIHFYEAENGQQAVEMTKQLNPDLVVMDIRMPVMGGIEACARIKQDQLTRHIPVVALTASISLAELPPAKHRNFDAFLHKPTRKNEIVEVFKQHLKFDLEQLDTIESVVNITQENLTIEQGKILLAQLNGQIDDLFVAAQSSGLIDDIKLLANNLQTVGSQFDTRKILDYSNELMAAVDLFDIEKIESLLLEFRALVSYYKVFVRLKGSSHDN